jgi:ABC-type glycerol-3-phosphate transport system substrate-binding protein
LLIAACAAGWSSRLAPAKAQEPVTIQYWSTAWFPSSIAGRKRLVDTFNKEYEGRIHVEYVQGDWDQGETYIQSGAAAGGGIACVVEWDDEGGAQNWYRKGWTLDLRPYLTQERRALTSEEQWKARTFPDDGAIVSSATVLWEPAVILLYNPAHFEAAGIAPATSDDPWTWDELYENAGLLTVDGNGKHLGEVGFDPGKVKQWGYLPRLDPEKVWEYGLRFAEDRMGAPVIREQDGVWGWNLTAEAVKTYERFLTPVQAGIAPQLSIGLTGDSQYQAFVDGVASIMLAETFAIPILHDNYPEFKFAAMPAPRAEGDKIFYKAGGEGMVITKHCDHPKDAAEFIFWMMKPENLAVYAYQNGMIPANAQALGLEPFKSDPNWDIIRDYLSKAEVFSEPFNPNLNEFRDTVVAPTLMEVVEGKRTFADANALLQAKAKEMLN